MLPAVQSVISLQFVPFRQSLSIKNSGRDRRLFEVHLVSVRSVPFKTKGNHSAPVKLYQHFNCLLDGQCVLVQRLWTPWPEALCTGRQAGFGKTGLLLNWSTVDVFFIRLCETYQSTFSDSPCWDGRKTLKSLGVVWTQPSVARWRLPRGHDLAGVLAGAPRAQRRWEPGRGTETRSRRERGG